MTRVVAAIVLAAGRGTRFAPDHEDTKITAPYLGTPLVRRVVETALRSRAAPVVVVSGHAHRQVEAALSGLDIRLVQNADYASGLASSVKAGLAAVGPNVDGVLMMLGDMPLVTAETLDRLIERFEVDDRIDAIVPTFGGSQGNPVLIGRSLFEQMKTLQGDEGARWLLARPGLLVEYCEVCDRGILIDIDTRADLAALGQRLEGA